MDQNRKAIGCLFCKRCVEYPLLTLGEGSFHALNQKDHPSTNASAALELAYFVKRAIMASLAGAETFVQGR
jgi:hypothetical protein